MKTFLRTNQRSLGYRLIVAGTVLCFAFTLITPPVSAQSGSELIMPGPGTRVQASQPYIPPVIKGVTIHPDKPFYFDFIIDKGNAAISGAAFEDESLRLIKYFLASLAVPDGDLWVNLSPYESDRIIPDKFGRTEMGRDLLAQDYLLKQFTASLMYPEDRLGEEFWKRVHQRAQERFGHTDIPVSTFNKVWIVPDKAVIHEHGTSAFVAESRLKVMLEEDYRALENNVVEEGAFEEGGHGEAYRDHRQAIAQEIIREVLLPEIEREVNEGEHFARLRQIYHSLLLATWYKEGMRRSILNQVYSNQNKVDGVEIPDEQTKVEIYQKYVRAFQVGVYNYVKEEYDPDLGEVIPRKYFSGGMNIKPRITTVRNPGAVRQAGDMAVVATQFDLAGQRITRRTDAAVLANDDQARMERGQRLKAVEKIFINQFSLLTDSLISLMALHIQTFGFQEETSARAFEELQQAFRTENLRDIFRLERNVDLGMAHAPIADRFERFRQSVTLNLGLLRSEIVSRNEERSAQLLLKMIAESVQFLERVFDRRLQFRAVDITEEVRDLAEQFENTFNVPVEVRVLEDNIGGIKIDRLRMAEVFYILFNNAREAGGEITVTVELSEDKSDVLFHVSDTGKGIAPEVLPRIFERGFTTKATEDTPRGIGLNLAKLIIEMHGGHMDVESQVDIGTDFVITLPRRLEGPALTGILSDVIKEMQVQVPDFQGDRKALKQRVAAARRELLSGDTDRIISLGVVPDNEDRSQATFDVGIRIPHVELFPKLDEGGQTPVVNDRMVRHVLLYDKDGTLAGIMVDPPNHVLLNRTRLPEIQESQIGQDLMILSARFLSGYDTVTGLFSAERVVAPDTKVLFRDSPVAGVGTLGDLAQRETKIVGISDKAVLVNPHMAEAWTYIWDRRVNLLNQNQLSKQVGRNRGYINHLSKGKDIPGQELFEQILDALGIPEADRPEAQRLLELARANRSNVPQSFIDLGKALRDLRRNANAYVFALERAQVKTDTRADIATATGLDQPLIESLYIGSEILDDAAYDRLLDAFKVPNKFRAEARERLQRQRDLEHLAWNKLTERLGITEAYLSQLETGKTLVSRQVLHKLLNEIGAQTEEAENVRHMHKLAVLDRMIINTGKTTIALNRIDPPAWRSLVETVQTYYRTYLGTTRPADQVTPEEVQWALYYRLAQEVNRQVVAFLEPVQDGLEFDFSRPFSTELIANAMDSIQASYGPDYRRGRITVEVKRQGDTIIVSVGDNGQGIKEDMIADLGRRPFTFEETGKAVDRLRYLGGQGTSLLSLYRSAAEHEIEIRAANRKQGDGAEFSLILPEHLFLANGDKAVLSQVPTALDINGEALRIVPLSRQEALTNPEYKRLYSFIRHYRRTPFEQRDMDDDFSFAIVDARGNPVGFTMLTHGGSGSVVLEDFVVDPRFQGTRAAAWLLYHTFSHAAQRTDGQVRSASWKLDFNVSGVEQRASTFYRGIGARARPGKTDDSRAKLTMEYSFDFAEGMPVLLSRYQSKPVNQPAGAAAELAAYRDSLSRLFDEQSTSPAADQRRWRESSERLSRDEDLFFAVVPAYGDAQRTRMTVRPGAQFTGYDSFFRASSNMTSRMVRGRYTPAIGGRLTLPSRRQEALMILETPQFVRWTEGQEDLAFNVTVLTARYLTGYDAARAEFVAEKAVVTEDVPVVVRGEEEADVFSGTLRELASQPLRGIEDELKDGSDKAVLSRQRILEWLDGVTGHRYQFAADLTRNARMWNRQMRGIADNEALVFGILPNPVSLETSSLDIQPLRGDAEHSRLFNRNRAITNHMVRGSFFKKSSRGIPELVFQTPRNLEFGEGREDVRTNIFILAARYMTGYDAESGEFDLAKAVINEDYEINVLDPERKQIFRGPIREFAKRNFVVSAASPFTGPGRTDSAVLSRPEEVGGIDLTAERLNIEIRRDAAGEMIPLDDQQLQNIHINGLIPVIIQIQPVTNLPLLIGAVDADETVPVAAGSPSPNPSISQSPAPDVPGVPKWHLSRR